MASRMVFWYLSLTLNPNKVQIMSERYERDTGKLPLESSATVFFLFLATPAYPITTDLVGLTYPEFFYVVGRPRVTEQLCQPRPENWHYERRLSKVARLTLVSPVQQSVSSFYGSCCLKIVFCSKDFKG